MSKSRRLLFVTEAVPYPLTDGGNIRSFHILEALASAFQVTLVGSTPEPRAIAEPDHPLRQLCARVVAVPRDKARSIPSLTRTTLLALTRGKPLRIAYNYNAGIAEALRQESREAYDVIHLNHADSAQYGLPLAGFRAIDSHNLLFDYHRKAARLAKSLGRIGHAFTARHLQRYELSIFRTCDRVLVCSDAERRILVGLGLAERVLVVPNGVDSSYFHPGEEPSGPPTLAFSANMAYAPNEEAALLLIREILPLVQRAFPEARLVLVGKGPSPRLLSLAAQTRGASVTGEVADVRDFLRSAHVFVAPLRVGSGTRLKLLEAFALGLAVVATPLAAEGLECEDARHLLLAEGPEKTAAAVLRLLGDPQLRSKMALAGRDLAASRYDWALITGRLLASYGE